MYFNVSSCSLQLNQQPGELKILSMLYCSSFCLMHRPTQGVSLKLSSNQTCPICFCQVDWNSKTPFTEIPLVTPCCKMTWFHNSCLQVTRFFLSLTHSQPSPSNKINIINKRSTQEMCMGKDGKDRTGESLLLLPIALPTSPFSVIMCLQCLKKELGTSQF